MSFFVKHFFFQNLSLKLYYRMFGAHTANVTKTVYLGLVDVLSQLFQGGVVTLSMGVDPADDRCIQLLAKVSHQYELSWMMISKSLSLSLALDSSAKLLSARTSFFLAALQ